LLRPLKQPPTPRNGMVRQIKRRLANKR